MRCLIHDFAGHPFPVQLSRALAHRGHHVTHAWPIGLQGPKGRLGLSASDSGRLDICGVPLRSTFRKYSPTRRLAAQRQYAGDLKGIISSGRFDVVLSGNTPIDVQFELLAHCRRNHIGFVHWVQDVYCQALKFFLRRKAGPLATPLSFPFFLLERSVASRSDANVVIASSFADFLAGWGVPRDRISILENWAPLDEIPSLPRRNAWSREHNLDGKTTFIYSGTLGLKHRPDLLYSLATSLGPGCSVVAITEGPGREYLERKPKLGNLLLLDFQPYERVPEVLASADVLLATLESDAGQFAVPSKILSYLCAGRPLLLAAPKSNLASSIIERSGGGFVVDPNHPEQWLNAANLLAESGHLRAVFGERARRYAEREFEISRIAARFEDVLESACILPTKSVVPTASLENQSIEGPVAASASEIHSQI